MLKKIIEDVKRLAKRRTLPKESGKRESFWKGERSKRPVKILEPGV